MDFKVIFKDTFLDDLERLVRWIAGYNPTAALKLGERIIQDGKTSLSFPNAIPKSGSDQESGDMLSANTTKCSTGCIMSHEPWRCCVAGMVGVSPTPSFSNVGI